MANFYEKEIARLTTEIRAHQAKLAAGGNDDGNIFWLNTQIDEMSEEITTLLNAIAAEQAAIQAEYDEQISLEEYELIMEHAAELQQERAAKGTVDDYPYLLEWQKEIAREEGMLGGIDAYNDVMEW